MSSSRPNTPDGLVLASVFPDFTASDSTRLGEFDIIALLPESRGIRGLWVFLAPHQGPCEDLEKLHQMLMRLPQTLGRKHSLVDSYKSSDWSVLYYDDPPQRGGPPDSRIWLICFPDPLIALGVAVRKAEDRGSRSLIIPDLGVAGEVPGLDLRRYHAVQRRYTRTVHEDGTRIVYPGDRVIKVRWLPRPAREYIWEESSSSTGQ